LKSEILKPELYSEWDAFVNAHPLATVFHLAGWNRIAKKVYGIESAIVVSRDENGRIAAGTPVFFAKRPGSWYVTSGIFGSYGPLLARENSGPALRNVLDGAIEFARAKKAKFMHLKGLEGPKGKNDFQHPSYARQDIWVTAFLPIGGTKDELWKSLPGPMRTKVRKAEKSELTAKWGTEERDLEQFYDVLADNMHRKGSPIYGIEFMREILREFGGAAGDAAHTEASILTLSQGEDVASGAILLRHAGVVYVPFVSSRAKYFPLRPNNLLYWEIIRDGNERGMQWLDFGTSIRGASTLQFKESWGAKTYPVVSYVYSESGEPVRLDPGGSVQFGVALWKKLPRRTADWLGPKLAKLMV
jgi:lipid II:glycine glycyltransferase (peptidoglycan interpeptide bridge formation enzyme)